MNRWWIVVAIAVASIAAGCGKREAKTSSANPSTRATSQHVGPFQISLETRPERPVVGDNNFRVALRDSAGRPVRGASLPAIVSMPAMGAMARMESRGEFRETGAGYEASYGVQMGGDWDVTLSIRAPGVPDAQAVYRVSTNMSGVAFVGGSPPTGGVAGADTAALSVAAVTIDAARRQAIGIRTESVTMQDLKATIRAAGRVTYDETRRAEISLKFSGWIRDIRVDYVGRQVSMGEVLFTVYSPELLSAQQEYLEALRGQGEADLAAAARQRLLLWDIAPSTLDAIGIIPPCTFALKRPFIVRIAASR
jgi:Cu(I)/Ag(I) efflux system membrane fusion protein